MAEKEHQKPEIDIGLDRTSHANARRIDLIRGLEANGYYTSQASSEKIQRIIWDFSGYLSDTLFVKVL